MGRLDQIEFKMVLREGQEDEDAAAMAKAFEAFNAQDCACFSDVDKQHLLSIIHAAFGDMESFNQEVSDIFHQAQWQKVCRMRTGEAYSSLEVHLTGLEAAAPRKARLRKHIRQPLRLFLFYNWQFGVSNVAGRCSLHA